jgi:hypothetical protein
MIKRTIFGAALALIIPVVSTAQSQQGSSQPVVVDPDRIVAVARQHLQKGEACLAAGDGECARREFDSAVDEFLQASVDLRSNERLLIAWRETIEKVNRYETAPIATTGKQFWRSQEFEGRPPENRAAESLAEARGPLPPGAFRSTFIELRSRFQEKYGRDLTITGADHAEHRRLYGSGSAYDIRVRDLTREQVKFIIATGSALGLRIKDFSTWESLAAHNARTLMLGRPLDTLATGVHLHIDRMSAPKKMSLTTVPVITAKPRQAR